MVHALRRIIMLLRGIGMTVLMIAPRKTPGLKIQTLPTCLINAARQVGTKTNLSD
jgi:hypothetical protein